MVLVYIMLYKNIICDPPKTELCTTLEHYL